MEIKPYRALYRAEDGRNCTKRLPYEIPIMGVKIREIGHIKQEKKLFFQFARPVFPGDDVSTSSSETTESASVPVIRARKRKKQRQAELRCEVHHQICNCSSIRILTIFKAEYDIITFINKYVARFTDLVLLKIIFQPQLRI